MLPFPPFGGRSLEMQPGLCFPEVSGRGESQKISAEESEEPPQISSALPRRVSVDLEDRGQEGKRVGTNFVEILQSFPRKQLGFPMSQNNTHSGMLESPFLVQVPIF